MSARMGDGGQAAMAQIDAAVRALRAGDVVAFPTETVYGLGADARNPVAVTRVFELKGRPRSHPLIVHLHDASQVGDWAAWTSAATTLAARFWPGPLTLVLKRKAGVPDAVTGGQDTVALRVPSHPVARRLLAEFGGGIAAPSANRYGHVSPTCAAHVREEFGADSPLVLDGGDSEWGLESAIVDCSGAVPTLLRPGTLGTARLREAVPVLAVGAGMASPRVPGSTPSHYAPRTPLVLVPEASLESEAAALARSGQRAAVLARRAPRAADASVHWLQAVDAADGYAHSLYANLRTLDRLHCARILVQSVPDAAEWDAVRDRLRRAAAGQEDPSDDPAAVGVMP